VAFTSAKLLQEALVAHGARVFVDDPLFSDAELEAMGYQPLRPEQRREIRAIILQAAHQSYQSLDFSQFSACQLVFDGRRALKPEAITAAGMRYLSIGDGNQPLIAVG
jgi:UDP-N-acetyl-D-mannosaminuronate dehydrogenase